MQIGMDARRVRPTFTTCIGRGALHVKTENSYEFVDLLYIVVYIYGKRYVPDKEYIHMISSYITADWSNIE